MSEYDAKRFIAENTSDRRAVAVTPALLNISKSIFGKNSLTPPTVTVGGSSYCDSCGEVPVSNEGDWCPKCERRAQDEYNESANADYGRHFD